MEQITIIERISKGGTKEWGYLDDKSRFILHRDGDLPAVEYEEGGSIYYKHGKKHRDNDKPAEITSWGTEVWWYEGEKHRDGNKPAFISKARRRQYYYIHGVRCDEKGAPLPKKEKYTKRRSEERLKLKKLKTQLREKDLYIKELEEKIAKLRVMESKN